MIKHTPQPEQLAVYRKSLEHFLSFSDEQWAIFSEHVYTREIKKKQLFISAGKICNEVGFIFSGSFRFYLVKDAVEISNYFCFEGELISSYKSFLRKEPSLTCIEAMEDAVVLCFNHTGLTKLVDDDRIAFKMERFGRLVAEYLICCYEDRLITFVSKTPEERYMELLVNQPGLLQRIPQYYLANFLGITPVSLSRIKRRLYNELSLKKEKV